jgi:hypothetical protein
MGRVSRCRAGSSLAPPVSGRTGTQPWTITDCCQGVTLRRGPTFRTSGPACQLIIKIGFTSRTWTLNETLTSAIYREGRTSWCRTRAASPWTRSTWVALKNRTKSKTRTTRCCTPTRATPPSSAQATTHNQITSRSEDRNSPAQAASTSLSAPPRTSTLSRRQQSARSQFRPSTRTATDNLTSTTVKTCRMER